MQNNNNQFENALTEEAGGIRTEFALTHLTNDWLLSIGVFDLTLEQDEPITEANLPIPAHARGALREFCANVLEHIDKQ